VVFPRRSVAAILAAAAVAAACDPQEAARRAGARTRLSIATGGTGGVYYPYGGAIARLITAHLPNVEATAEVTAASVDNLKLVRDHKSDIAFSLADTLGDAIAGRGAFARKGPVPARVLAVLYDNYTHLVASRQSGVARVADLAGKHVSLGAAGSGTELVATRVLRAAGLHPGRDIRPVSLGVAQSVDAFKDGKIDAFFWSGGVPTASVLDLASTRGVGWRLVPNDDALGALQAAYGPSLYTRLVVPRSAYPGLQDDVAVVGVSNLLVVHADMPEPLAHDITALLFDHQADLVSVHREAAHLTPARDTTASPAPFHPGAIRFYRERGSWVK
jgi:TRAP transporter TAXI family solute receptor